MLDLSAWPKGMRAIVRKERPHPGAQLRFTDLDGHRFTAFATSTKGGQLADLELRHRRRTGCEDRIRCTKTPDCATCPSGGSRRTRSGARSSRWPASCWLGCRCSPWTARPADGNPNACGCACSPPPGASSAGAAACGCTSPQPGPGPPRSSLRSPGCRPACPADRQQPAPATERTTTRPMEPAHPARQPGLQARPDAEKDRQPQRQVTKPRSRKMQAKGSQPHLSLLHHEPLPLTLTPT
jgi:hypothetical protein